MKLRKAKLTPSEDASSQPAGDSVNLGTRGSWRRVATRARLLQSAYDVMCRKGVDAATIQQITESAQVGFGTFYNYFRSKDDVAAGLLDCMINDLGLRNDLATQAIKSSEPARVMPVSVRLTLREAARDPFWRWWAVRPNLLHDRMQRGFGPFATRDLRNAVRAGCYSLEDREIDATWSLMVWMMVGALCDIVSDRMPLKHEKYVVEMITRVAGANPSEAHQLVADPLPRYPAAKIDFSFELGQLRQDSRTLLLAHSRL